MAAYAVLTFDILDAEALITWRERARHLAAAYGGKLLVRGDVVDVIGGEMPPTRRRIIVFEFESMEQAREWDTLPQPSPEQAETRALRSRVGTVTTTFVEGDL